MYIESYSKKTFGLLSVDTVSVTEAKSVNSFKRRLDKGKNTALSS